MAPNLLATRDAAELRELGQKIRAWQTERGLSDTAMVKRFGGLGSTKTYTRVHAGDLAELDLDRQLANYRAVWALLESVEGGDERGEELYDDLSPVVQLKRAVFDVFRQTGNARFVLMEGDTGLGKSKARGLLIEKYGQRLLWVEATEVWNDSPGAFLAAVMVALGIREVPQMAVERLNRVLARLNETRVCLIVDELHHAGPRILNTLKTILNQSPGEVVGLAMPTLWRRIEREAYEEVRQLTGNRLAERIKLALRESDVAKLITRRVPEASDTVKEATRLLMDRAPRYGNLAFVSAVCSRVAELAEGHDGPDLETWGTAISQEVARR
jgi:hypothetical protein